jgi:hypothetical protein
MSYLLDLADQKPAMGVAMRMYQFIDIPDTALQWLMTENDITMSQIQILWLRYFHANRLRDEMTAYLGHLKTAFLDGVISEDQFEIELLTFKGSQEEIDKILADMSLEFQRRLTMTEYETRTWLYRKGVYDTTLELESTTTNDGAVDGSTMIDTVRTEANDYFNGMFMWLENGEFRTVTDWDLASHTFTFASPFEEQVLTGVDYAVYTVTSEETFYEQLALLGVSTAIVNATVRLEASKKGLNWEKS